MSARQFVSRFQNLLGKGKSLKAARVPVKPRPPIPIGTPKALIFSPHPDDECIVGGLALRLLREVKWNAINVAVTLGSKKERRAARLRELRNACALLGFGLMVAGGGLERITPESRKHNRTHWKSAVKIVAQILAEQRPRMIFLPHENDLHPAHIGTHFLVLDALKTLPPGFQCHVIETEFWGQMANPNLLVELNVDDVASLIGALACHTGEVRRNAYHARLPAWMIDNVRRGAELVGGQGGTAPDFTFGVIYRVQEWSRGKLIQPQRQQRFLPRAVNARKFLQ